MSEEMRLLVGEGDVTDLEGLYAPPRLPWLRVNMVSTLDGAAWGADGVTTSINDAADRAVFDTLRGLADCVLVGAGTARAEEYAPLDVPLVVVSGRGSVPETLRGAEPGRVLMATSASAAHLDEARELLGTDHVVTAGDDGVDLAAVVAALHERGLRHVLCEGGPALLGRLLADGLVDELCATVSPTLVAGDADRIVTGPDLAVDLRLVSLLESGGTLLGRWCVAQ